MYLASIHLTLSIVRDNLTILDLRAFHFWYDDGGRLRFSDLKSDSGMGFP